MKDTKERILAEGLDLVSQAGFAGVTLSVLAQRTGMSKSGLFAHFGSKQGIQLDLLEQSLRVGAATFIEPAMRNPPGLARLRAIVDGWFGWTVKAGLHGGCPVAAGLFELDDADTSDPLRQRLFAVEEHWRRFLGAITAEAVAAGELRADLDVDQFVWELCGMYLNHHVSYRFIHDPLALERATMAFAGLLNRSAAKPAARKKTASRKQNLT